MDFKLDDELKEIILTIPKEDIPTLIKVLQDFCIDYKIDLTITTKDKNGH